ncbi:WD40-repeat-containing domain protein [Mortierella sp. GBAus27b]|nr:WD40-repeat-containing domain protein [Mortierella sp. GBAus27b]
MSTGGQWNGHGQPPSASSALASISVSTPVSTLAASLNTTSTAGLTVIRDPGSSERGHDHSFGSPERSKSPEFFPAGSLSPHAHRLMYNLVSTPCRNWNRFLSINQEEMAKSMQFAFNDWKCFEGQTSGIRVLGANEYQRILASGSKDRTVKLWSLDIHRSIENPDYAGAGSGCLMTYNGHRRGAVYDLHFVTGGGSFGTGDIVASCDGQIHPETGKTVHQFVTGKVPVISMAPIHRLRYIVAGLLDSTLTLLDSHTHANLHTWRTTSHQGIVARKVTTSPSETLIATGFSNGAVSLLESRTGTLVGSWKASENEITQFLLSPYSVLPSSLECILHPGLLVVGKGTSWSLWRSSRFVGPGWWRSCIWPMGIDKDDEENAGSDDANDASTNGIVDSGDASIGKEENGDVQTIFQVDE